MPTKDTRIEVRCTSAEKEEWTSKAYPLTISQFVRFLLTHTKARGSDESRPRG